MLSIAQSSGNPVKRRSWSREQTRFIQAAGRTAHEIGIGRLVGRVYALLLLEPGLLCLDEIMDRLSISKASASITLRRLAAWRLVHRVAEERGRRDFYQIENDFSKVLGEGLVPLARSKLDSAGQVLDGMLGAIPPQSADSAAGSVRNRLEEIRMLQEKLSLILQFALSSRFSP